MPVEGRCKETAGFLFAHPCKRPATSACSGCQKPICATHNRQGRCIACFKEGAVIDAGDPFMMASWYYADYESYSAYDAYSKKDREAFADGGEPLGDDDWEADWEADFDGT